MFRESFAGDVEGRAVIDGGPDEWQTKRHINGLTKRQTLYRNHRLIVITRNHCIKLATRSAQKNSISRERSLHVDIIESVARLRSQA